MVDPFSVRGELCNFFQIVKDNASIKLVADWFVDNKGGITEVQNTNLVKKHLIDYGVGLCSYIKDGKSDKKIIKYYNFNTHNQHYNF